MFLENESELCECKVNVFSADKVMTTCLVLHTDYHILWEFSFRQLSTLQSILLGVFPWDWKKKTNKQTNARSILKISRYCFSETRVNLAFYVTALSRHIHLMFLSICLQCCCLKRKLRIVFYPRLILFPIILYFYFDGWRQLKHWAYKVSYEKA